MKWLIYLFLLLNIGFFVWHYQSGTTARGTRVVPVDETAVHLVLLKEYLAQQEQATSQTEVPISQTVASCYTLGPLQKKARVEALRKDLEAQGIQAERRLSKDKVRQGYWVLLPPAGTRKAARDAIGRLKTAGITDYFLVATGEQKNAISLGVFSRAELAKRHLKKMQAAGFAAEIEPVDLPKREYWLDWPVDGGHILEPAELEQLQKSYPGLGLTQRQCPADSG